MGPEELRGLTALASTVEGSEILGLYSDSEFLECRVQEKSPKESRDWARGAPGFDALCLNG